MSRRPLIAVFVVLALVFGLTACGADGGDEPAAGSSTTTTAGGSTEPPTDDQLQAMLLTGEDVPSGFREAAEDDDDEDDEDDDSEDLEAEDPTCQEALDVLNAREGDDDEEPDAEVSFERNQADAIEHQIQVSAEDADAMSEVGDVLRNDCGGSVELAVTDYFTGGSLEVVDGTPVGDESLYLHMVFEGEQEDVELKVDAYLVAIRNGDVLEFVTTATFAVPQYRIEGEPPTLADAEALAVAAQARYEAAVD